jgi:lysine 2,3-aminomutase
MGEDIADYESIWGYSLGETEQRSSLYEYPDYEFTVTSEFTNLEGSDIKEYSTVS